MNNLFKQIAQKKTTERRKEEMTEPTIDEQRRQAKKFEQEMIEKERDKYKESYILTELQYKILQTIKQNPSFSQQKIADLLGILQNRVCYNLKQIKKNNPSLIRELQAHDQRTKLKIYRF